MGNKLHVDAPRGRQLSTGISYNCANKRCSDCHALQCQHHCHNEEKEKGNAVRANAANDVPAAA